MTRLIKFRGRRLDNGQWLSGSLVVLSGRTFIFDEATRSEIDPATVGQYTGLKDKNGREIYEGDIVKSPRYNVLAVVCFIKGGFDVCDPNCCDTCAKFEGAIESLYEAIVLSNGELAVVGNLHDTPELLKK